MLLPQPKRLQSRHGTHTIPDNSTISLCGSPESFFTAQQLQRALTATIHGDDFPADIRLRLAERTEHPQGYTLDIAADHIEITGHDQAGLFYGVMTLLQLVETQGTTLPQLTITDWPDFLNRGVMLDISRDKVPTVETLYALVDLLASWKINQLQLYTEHTFAYREHRAVWEQASPMTAEEILALDIYCQERFVELVPNQNSFGHMHRWFKHPAYLPMAEIQNPDDLVGLSRIPPYSLSPAVPQTLDFLGGLYAELLPNFSSTLFNVGCDETFDLGDGLSKAMVEARGKGRVYLDFLLEIDQLVKQNNRTMMFWGDIITQYPDLVPQLPRDIIALDWGYEADHPFTETTRLFAEAGIPFYVCPGTSSWCTVAGRTDNCMRNIRNAVENGLQHGAIGVLNTDWGDYGHWQPLPVSYLGFAYGAALSWDNAQNRDIDLPAALDAFAFRDSAGVMGRLAYDLGNAYQLPGVLVPNGSLLFWAYHYTPEQAQQHLTDHPNLVQQLDDTIEQIDAIIAPLKDAQPQRPDADLLRREFALVARILQYGARHLQVLLGAREGNAGLADIEQEFQSLWLARYRPGGLDDSLSRFRINGSKQGKRV